MQYKGIFKYTRKIHANLRWFQQYLKTPCSVQDGFKNTWKCHAAFRKTSRILGKALQLAERLQGLLKVPCSVQDVFKYQESSILLKSILIKSFKPPAL